MTNPWIAVAALLALGLPLAAPGAQAAECPTSGKALADAWAADYLPRPAAELKHKGGEGFAELAQWHGYALHQGLTQTAPGSSAEACLKAIDDYYLSRLNRGHALNMYMAGMLGAAPQGALAGVSQPDRLLGMLGDLLRDQTADASGGGGDDGGSADARFIGTWDLVDLAILEDGKRVPNVGFNYLPDAWVMTFLADGRLIVEGRMVTELNGMPAGSKIRGAWFSDDGGRTMTLKMGGDNPAKCRVTDHTAEFLWYQCPSRHDPRFANAFKLQRLSR